MSRILNISDQMLLYNILDVIETHKQSESVAYLQSIYGIENLQEYIETDKYEYLDLFTEKEIVEYFGDELLFEYKDEELYNWIDRDWLYKTVNLEEFISNNKILRKHIIDGCQALNLNVMHKYERAFGKELKDYKEGVSFKKIFTLIEKCSSPIIAKKNIITWIIVNLCLGNSDAHGKNISFFI